MLWIQMKGKANKKMNKKKKEVKLEFIKNDIFSLIKLAKEKKKEETKDCICMPMCIKHDCPRPCPICDKEWFESSQQKEIIE